MKATIYKPAKNAMQSGRANTRDWVLEFDQAAARRIDPLMGWTSSTDMNQQVRLRFDSRDDAVEYCTRNGIDFEIRREKTRTLQKKSYADNFSYYTKRGFGSEPLPRP